MAANAGRHATSLGTREAVGAIGQGTSIGNMFILLPGSHQFGALAWSVKTRT